MSPRLHRGRPGISSPHSYTLPRAKLASSHPPPISLAPNVCLFPNRSSDVGLPKPGRRPLVAARASAALKAASGPSPRTVGHGDEDRGGPLWFLPDDFAPWRRRRAALGGAASSGPSSGSSSGASALGVLLVDPDHSGPLWFVPDRLAVWRVEQAARVAAREAKVRESFGGDGGVGAVGGGRTVGAVGAVGVVGDVGAIRSSGVLGYTAVTASKGPSSGGAWGTTPRLAQRAGSSSVSRSAKGRPSPGRLGDDSQEREIKKFQSFGTSI